MAPSVFEGAIFYELNGVHIGKITLKAFSCSVSNYCTGVSIDRASE